MTCGKVRIFMATDFFGNNVNVGDKLKCGALRKFIVIKEADAIEYLNYDEKVALEVILVKINNKRAENQRKCDNEYFVINTDEPYAGEIIEILKRNGHWGEPTPKSEMKFFEFNGNFAYYALIGANTIDDAMDFYKETVSDLEEDDGFPDEITKDEAKAKFSKVPKDEYVKEFDELSRNSEPTIFLIDGSLV
jgi:hypothetical protein